MCTEETETLGSFADYFKNKDITEEPERVSAVVAAHFKNMPKAEEYPINTGDTVTFKSIESLSAEEQKVLEVVQRRSDKKLTDLYQVSLVVSGCAIMNDFYGPSIAVPCFLLKKYITPRWALSVTRGDLLRPINRPDLNHPYVFLNFIEPKTEREKITLPCYVVNDLNSITQVYLADLYLYNPAEVSPND